jgi:hypothetical protein
MECWLSVRPVFTGIAGRCYSEQQEVTYGL